MSADQQTRIYEWKLEQIRQYYAAWDAGELPSHRALDGIAGILAVTDPGLAT